MTFSEYARIDAANWSKLKAGRKSALHLRHAMNEPVPDTAAMLLGRSAHTAVFEPDRFPVEYAVFPGPRRQGKAWDEFCAANQGRTILRADEYMTCLAIRDAVRGHPVAGPALAPPGEAEKVLQWQDPDTGIACKARLDWYRTGLLCDLKTTSQITPREFSATAHRMGYFGQLAFYQEGLARNRLDAPRPIIIAVETTPPHDVAVYRLTDDALEAGEVEWRELLRMLSAGRFSGRWPGRYEDQAVDLDLPQWAYAEGESLDGLGLIIGAANQEG